MTAGDGNQSEFTNLLLENYTFIGNNSSTQPQCVFHGHNWLEAKLILMSICGTIVACFGIFGNLTTALILTRPSMRSPNNLYLTALAAFDTCLLVTAMLIYSVEYIIEYTANFQMYVAWLTYLRFCFALSHISQTGSVYTTVAVTIERYLAVVHPRRSRYICTKRGASVSILGVTCFSILFNCTKFFELEIKRRPGCPKFSAYSLDAGPLQSAESYQVIYSLWTSNMVMVFLPFITLLVFNSVIAWTIRRSLHKMSWTESERRQDRNELKEKSRDATRVLVIIVLMFLICNLWGFVITLMEVIYGRFYLYTNLEKFYAFSREATNFLAMVNSSINFVIYVIFGKDFRNELIVVYGCSQGITLSLPVEDKFSAWRSLRRRISNRSVAKNRKKSDDPRPAVSSNPSDPNHTDMNENDEETTCEQNLIPPALAEREDMPLNIPKQQWLITNGDAVVLFNNELPKKHQSDSKTNSNSQNIEDGINRKHPVDLNQINVIPPKASSEYSLETTWL